jgi:hypothetical protein
MTQLINFSTRGDNIIDIFATTNPALYTQPIRLSSLGRSDHAGFFLQTVNTSLPPSSQKVATRDFRKKNHDLFLFILHQVDWNFLKSDSLDHTISLFNDFVNFLFDLCFPLKFVRLRSNDPPCG